MDNGIILILALLFSIGSCIFCPYWIKTARDNKDRSWGVFCLVTSIIMFFGFSWAVIYDNNLLWEGQNNSNSHIEMNINTDNVEQSSFIYLIEQLGPDTSVDDVIKIMGSNYEESIDSGYEMKYTTSKYTLNGNNSTFISFKFNKRKTEILSIKWAYRSPTESQFTDTLQYLENNAFGKANSSSVSKADWTGLHLEDTDYFLLFIREF